MNTTAVKADALVVQIGFTENAMTVSLADGREVSVPLEWYPRLRDASPEQREGWRLIGNGIGIHWEDIDEDVSVKSILAYS